MAVQVLICDDRDAFRDAAREVVKSTPGFEVAGEVATGEDSVVAAGRLQVDLVLMDVHLPGIDGLEASRQIRAAHPEVTVVLLSTDDPEGVEPLLVGSGAISFISKMAFGPDSLKEVWATAVGVK